MATYGAELTDRLKSLRLRMHVVSNPSHPWHSSWTADAGGAEAEKQRIRAAQAKIEKQLDKLEAAIVQTKEEWKELGAGQLLQADEPGTSRSPHTRISDLRRDLGKAAKLAQLLQ